MSNVVLDVQHVSHRYGDRPALQDISLQTREGELVALLGPNGSGKTTLFRIISTLMRPSSGTVRVAGADVSRQPSEARQQLGVVFQHAALDADLTVRENLRHHAALYGLSGARAVAAIDEAIRAMGLSDRADERVKRLSGGLARRADLARVLLHDPALLLLDEPTTGLDPSARREFWLALEPLRARKRTAILVATHLLDEADDCDRVCIMSEGRLVAEDTPDALKSALGDETLWLEADDPADLADRLQARLGLDARVVGESVHVSHPQAHQLLGRVYEAFPGRVESATVRRPTLEDVYVVHTGHGLLDPANPAPETGSVQRS